MTGRDLITASMRKIGAKASGESMEASEATEGLAALNQMISSWSTESLLINAKVRRVHTLTTGDQQYTVGASGADFTAPRPLRVVEALIRDESVSPAIEYPSLRILSLAEWAAIVIKELGNSIPTDIYLEGTYPLETFNLYPKPSAGLKLVLWSWEPLTEIATLDTAISFPPGYEEALIYNFAIRLAPEYGKTIPAEVASVANDSKANIKRMNHRPRYLQVDAALVPRGRFNILTGDQR